MSTDMIDSQAAPRSPATDVQADKIGSFDLNQSSRPKKIRLLMKANRDNFLNTLKKVTEGRTLNKRQKISPDESSPGTGASYDVRDMDEASSPYQKTSDWKFSAVAITEAGNNDSGLLNASGQQSKKYVEAGPSLKATDSDQKFMRYQITDQIMRQAAFPLRKGQQEVVIVFKSDFLGHIRLLVISENQKVAVKILVENGFIKDLIESNLHQLKADLQHQGLEVGKLEVRIACESEASGSSDGIKTQWRAGQDKVRHPEHHNQKDDQQKENGPPPHTANNAVAVDYFA